MEGGRGLTGTERQLLQVPHVGGSQLPEASPTAHPDASPASLCPDPEAFLTSLDWLMAVRLSLPRWKFVIYIFLENHFVPSYLIVLPEKCG